MTFNALGTNLKDSDKTLADKLGIEMPEEKELTAKVLDTENLVEVKVELSNAKLVKDKEALINPDNYRITEATGDKKAHTVYNVDVEGNDVVLTLVPYGRIDELQKEDKAADPLLKGRKYDLTIRNVDTKINKTFKGILAGDNAIPVVENVDFMGDYGIKITTSEPIANPLERNFRLDSRTSMHIEQYGREIILTPYHETSFDKDATELTVDILDDFARYKSIKTVEKMELSDDAGLPKVEKAYRSGDKLTLVFDRDVYHKSVKSNESRRELGNVSFVERRVTFYADTAKKVDTNTVEYRFERDIPKDIAIAVEGVANHFNKVMDKDEVVPVELRDDYAPVIISSTEKVKVTTVDEKDLKARESADEDKYKKDLDAGIEVKTQEMTITFDKDISEFAGTGNDAKDYLNDNIGKFFKLYELDVTRRSEATEVTIKVTDANKDKVKLTFEDIKLNNKKRDFDYILEVRDLSDSNRNRMERDYLDFQVVRIADSFNVKVKPARPNSYFNRNGVEIVLEFNDYVNKEEASNARNYYLDGKLDVDEAIVERDGKTVALVVYDTDVDKFETKYKVLEISPRVKDIDNDNSVSDRFWDLKTGKPATDPVSEREAFNKVVESIKALPKVADIKLTDKEAIDEARIAFDALTAEQKALLTDELATLVAAEAAITALEADEGAEVTNAKGELGLVITDAETEADRTLELDQAILDAKKVLNKDNVTLKELKDAKLALETVLESFRKDVAEVKLTDLIEEIVDNGGPASNWMTLADLEVEGTSVTADFDNAVKTAIKDIYDGLTIDEDGNVEGADGSKKDAVEFAVDSYVMNTFARYIAELNPAVEEIVYKGETYTWNSSLGSASKWENGNVTLVSEVVNNSPNRGIRTVSFTIVDADGYSINMTFEATNVTYNYVF